MPREIVHVGRKIRVAVDTTTTPDGQTIRRDVILHPGAVVILPVIDRGHVCLLRNHRWVVGETLWELPAGTLEPGEELEPAARRELLEETGYQADRWRYLGYLFASPGVLDEKLHLFVAEGLTPGPNRPEADEQLEPVTVPFGEAVRMCLDGRIKDAKTVTALLLWERLLGEPGASATG
jgi:ADP-ribose pyrophosphatase